VSESPVELTDAWLRQLRELAKRRANLDLKHEIRKSALGEQEQMAFYEAQRAAWYGAFLQAADEMLDDAFTAYAKALSPDAPDASLILELEELQHNTDPKLAAAARRAIQLLRREKKS
jgi:hypothetical protein